MVEFAMVVGVFLVLLLAAVSASVYTLQRSAGVTAVAAGARTAAGASPEAGAGTPDLAGAPSAVARVVAPVMAGTHLREVRPPGDCRDLGSIPRGEMDICATRADDMVTVRLRGRPANAVPLPGLDWSLDLAAQVHAVTFAP